MSDDPLTTVLNGVERVVEDMAKHIHELKALMELVVVDLERVLMEESIDSSTRQRVERALATARRGIRGDVRRGGERTGPEGRRA